MITNNLDKYYEEIAKLKGEIKEHIFENESLRWINANLEHVCTGWQSIVADKNRQLKVLDKIIEGLNDSSE